MIFTVTLNPALDRELQVPSLVCDRVLRAVSVRVDCGGKGFNVSRQLAALDTKSAALGFAGGRSGELLQDELMGLGIPTDFVWIGGETRTNVSIVTLEHGHYIKVNEPGPQITKTEQASMRLKVRELARPVDWWVFAGSLPPGVPGTFYAELVRYVQAAGARAILDTSGEPLVHGSAAGPFLAKPNAGELAALTGLPVTSVDEGVRAARRMMQMGVDTVVVSLGRDGALLVNQAGNWLAPAPRIDEHNPIGAGDSLVAGLVWGLSQGCSSVESLRWGVACGAATASLDGTAVGERARVNALYDQVDVTCVGC